MWRPGMRSALDAARISEGRDIGYVSVSRITTEGIEPVFHLVTFAFAFRAFEPDGTIHMPR